MPEFSDFVENLDPAADASGTVLIPVSSDGLAKSLTPEQIADTGNFVQSISGNGIDNTNPQVPVLRQLTIIQQESTGGGTITLNFSDHMVGLFTLQSSLSTAKAIAFANSANAIRFDLVAPITNIAATLDFGSGSIFQSFDARFNTSTQILTFTDTGTYVIHGVYDGTNWWLAVRDDPYRSPFPQFTTATSTTAYTGTTNPAIASYSTGQKFQVKAHATSTGNATLNLNGVGAKKWFKSPTLQATTSDIVINQIYIVVYDAALDSAAGGFLIVGFGGGGGIDNPLTADFVWDIDVHNFEISGDGTIKLDSDGVQMLLDKAGTGPFGLPDTFYLLTGDITTGGGAGAFFYGSTNTFPQIGMAIIEPAGITQYALSISYQGGKFIINTSNLPSSASGLSSGDWWRDNAAAGVIKVVP